MDGNAVATGPAPDRYLVNLPINNPAGRLAHDAARFATTSSTSRSRLHSRGPRRSHLRAARHHREQARRPTSSRAVEIPYQESASSGATTTQFKKAVLALTVTPQITPDDRHHPRPRGHQGQRRPVRAERDAAASCRASTLARSQTQVLVNDGQTVVLGGILETERPRRTHQGAVPWRHPGPRAACSVASRKLRQQGRAADLRDAEDPARRRQHLLTPAPR